MMRLVHAALLTAIPAVAFGARVIQQAADAPPPPPPVPAADILGASGADAPTVRGDQVRARAFEGALASVDAEVLLGEAACTDAIIETTPQTARYAAGSRRYENPDYARLTAEQAAHNQALSESASEQATLRASLQLHAEREALQGDRSAHARRALRDAQRDLGDASAALSEVQTRLSRANSAASAIEQYGLRRNALETQIRDLRRSVSELEAQLAAAATARDDRGEAAAALATAEAQLAAASTTAEAARGAMRAARDNPNLSDAERARARQQARDAKAALEAAEADVQAAQRLAARADDSSHGGRHLGRTLRRQQSELAAAEQARATLQPPGANLHELAANRSQIERRVRRHAADVARAEHETAEATQQLHAQQDRVDMLAGERAEKEAVLSGLIAQEEELRSAMLSTEAALASVAPTRSRTLWDEVAYTVETRARTCTVDATLLWPDGTFTQARAQATDTDTTHDAYAEAQLAADRLDYGRSDAARIAAADRDLLAQLRAAAVGSGAVADAGDTGF